VQINSTRRLLVRQACRLSMFAAFHTTRGERLYKQSSSRPEWGKTMPRSQDFIVASGRFFRQSHSRPTVGLKCSRVHCAALDAMGMRGFYVLSSRRFRCRTGSLRDRHRQARGQANLGDCQYPRSIHGRTPRLGRWAAGVISGSFYAGVQWTAAGVSGAC